MNEIGCLQDIKEEYINKISPFISNNDDICNLETIIDNNIKSKATIKKLLEKSNFYSETSIFNNEENEYLPETKKKDLYRIKHTLFTFALGTLLCNFDDLESKIAEKYKKYFPDGNTFIKVWLLTSLYHDIGYYKRNKYEIINISSLDDINVINNIFDYNNSDDKTIKSRYTKQLIEKYFLYTLKYDEKEKLEHGILGGYTLFDTLAREPKIMMKNLFRDISYRIMEHNIWKLNDKRINDLKINCKDIKLDMFEKQIKKDLNEIYNDNFKIITDNEPLLFLLSLCDTIEFIKRIDDEEPNKQIKTILRNIEIRVTKNEIYIKYNNIKKIGFNKTKWKNSILSLKDWVDVLYDDLSNEKQTIIKIIKKENQNEKK